VKWPDFINYALQSSVMRGIEFKFVWFDQDMIEYQIRCSNGSFCGAAKKYLAHDDLSKAADLSGFPSHTKAPVASGLAHLSRVLQAVGFTCLFTV
jgi:hypothetical protein